MIENIIGVFNGQQMSRLPVKMSGVGNTNNKGSYSNTAKRKHPEMEDKDITNDNMKEKKSLLS